ncbi:hypothetical protein J2X69_003306 [Algoriphagus sp. 4150]|nr:hypothetical protein [Algoriphagus sp. 4150]MDR7130947.1 hypothetical protein [Algoriphagus sp. 4150]
MLHYIPPPNTHRYGETHDTAEQGLKRRHLIPLHNGLKEKK